MSPSMTIGKLAVAAGVKRSTIRFYEWASLLRPPGRSPHGYRQYDDGSLDRLRFIRASQSASFIAQSDPTDHSAHAWGLAGSPGLPRPALPRPC